MKHWRHSSITTDSKLEQVLTGLRPSSTPSGRVKMFALAATALLLILAPTGASAASTVYVTDGIGGLTDIYQFSIDPTSGVLSPLNPISVDDEFNSAPGGIAVSPDGKNAYVLISSEGVIRQYSIDQTTGALSIESTTTPIDGIRDFGPGIAISPDGASVYVTNNGNTVSQYDIEDSGELSPKSTATVAAGYWATDIAITPDGTSAYVANCCGGSISQYDIDPGNGDLSPKVPATVDSGDWPSDIVVSPDGTSVYITNDNDDTVSQFNIDPGTGALSPKGTPSVATGDRPSDIALSPSGASAYVTNKSDDSVSQYDIDSCTGVLTAKTNATVTTGRSPANIGISPDGANLYTVNTNDESVSHLSIDPNTGELAPKGAFKLPAGSGPGFIATSPKQSTALKSCPTTPEPGPTASTPSSTTTTTTTATSTSFSEACNLEVTSPKLRKTKNKVMRVLAKQTRRLFTHGVKGTMRWGTVDGKDVVCKKIKMVILQKRGKNYYIPGTRTRVSKKILTRKKFSTRGARFLKKKKVGKLRKKTRSSKRLTKLSYKDYNRRSKLGRRALNNLRKKRYRTKLLVLYSAEIDGTTVLKRIRLSS